MTTETTTDTTDTTTMTDTTETTTTTDTTDTTTTTDTESAGKWWEKLGDDQRDLVTKSGLTLEDPVEAVAKLADMERAAQRKLGAKPEDLMTKPKEGQSVAEWMKENGSVLGVPDAADGYEITPPDSWPKDAKWDTDFEAQVRSIAHEEGVPAVALNRLVAVYAEKVAGLEATADETYQQANQQMMQGLESDWGDQTKARMTMAKQAAAAVAEKAGLDQDGLQGMIGVLSAKTGDAQAIKFMAAIGEMMGEDQLAGLNSDAMDMGDTPAAARAKLAKLREPGGEYFEAVQANDRDKMARLQPEIERLSKLVS